MNEGREQRTEVGGREERSISIVDRENEKHQYRVTIVQAVFVEAENEEDAAEMAVERVGSNLIDRDSIDDIVIED